MKMPRGIASLLGLENANTYTGHEFRRAAATLLAQSGASMLMLKNLGGWKSDSSAQGYCDDSVSNKIKTSAIFSTNINLNANAQKLTATVTLSSSNLDSNSNIINTQRAKYIFNFSTCTDHVYQHWRINYYYYITITYYSIF